ncbi:penicillin acylase family protein [Alteromonas ponticola]|uniref:Penicillin acylase family protein n=1 Tax=Alteromonas aquimaris TaxID=2998417 RepID=A0ABT3P7M5_9ALTE|nr:penicillin acylase family protein [Alteromonas aquimaris]MCW8108776.1 penicillin acylase family protein [Alteromonas aquimaris]
MKWLIIGILSIVLATSVTLIIILRLSLPTLDGSLTSPNISTQGSLSRDTLGQAIISAENRNDAAYLLGLAHAQDRLTQMDLQRRVAAGELAQWLGSNLIEIDKEARFHQFRQRADAVFRQLDADNQALLIAYSKGVNEIIENLTAPPMEYLLTGFSPARWTPQDSILVAYSMYMDLQLGQVELDMARTGVIRYFGTSMHNFLAQPSPYQAALDSSVIADTHPPIPELNIPDNLTYAPTLEPLDIGSNNWAVTGALTRTGSGMLANDMHLGLRVPIIWYRTQLNYQRDDKNVQLTGVSLPGLPGVVVGTNGAIAWGFTNSNLDNVDWVELTESTKTSMFVERIEAGESQHDYELEMSPYGPVKNIDGKRYALTWVAHFPYAVNLNITNLDLAQSVDEALELAKSMAIPAQNFVVVDKNGNTAWMPGGAVSARPTPSLSAITEEQWHEGWAHNETHLPTVKNPFHNRIWTANSRVISVEQLSRFGDGGYALGARAKQIKQRLFEKEVFDESDFYAIQLDNKAEFLSPWQQHLLSLLQTAPNRYAEDIQALKNWQSCACESSVGYTLVRRYRSAVIDAVFSPIFSTLREKGIDPAPLHRKIEPALWQLITQQPGSWLPAEQKSWSTYLIAQYDEAKRRLFKKHNTQSLAELNWGEINALQVNHPFAKQIPPLANYLNMEKVKGYGDSYMPAVQLPAFGASQRFFVQPKHLEKAIMTIPGGQSGHPLSPYYKTGFDDYAQHRSTPLLPGEIEHTLIITPRN